jgi:hypothetical protein
MDEFVRNSLGSEFNFSEKPQILDSALMVIPDNHLISLSDNILPSRFFSIIIDGIIFYSFLIKRVFLIL